MKSTKPEPLDPSTLHERILSVLSSHTDPVTQKTFEDELSDITLTQMLPVLNRMQKEGQVEVLVNPDRTLSWRLREIDNMDKLKSLTDIEECLVYNCIRKNGNEGAALKVISQDTKLPQNRLPRILKALVGKKLIKELPILSGNKQKIYLLAELEPSRALAANTLFAGETGVDGEFVAMLRTACLKYIQDKADAASHILDPLISRNSSYASVEEIHRFITNAKLCTVSLNESDVKTILDALMFGGELEMRRSGGRTDLDAPDTSDVSSAMYRIAPRTPSLALLARVPCTICPSRMDCRPGGAISPTNCAYYKAFLEF
ncbi:DNA-directed RNA polymerase III subunit RPC6 [Sparganum proliferum]